MSFSVRTASQATTMKLVRIIIFTLATLIPILSAIAQDDEDFEHGEEEFGRGEEGFGRGEEGFGRGEEGFGRGEEGFGRGEEELGRGMEELRDDDVPPEGRILGVGPAFGLGLLGGHIGSSLIRNVGSFLGFRKTPPPQPLLRPPPAAFYPAPYIPAGLPYPPFPGAYPGAFPGRSAGGKGHSGREVPPVAPYFPAIPVGYYRSNEDDEQDDHMYENETY